VLEIAFQPDRRGEAPLARQLAEHLAGLIATARLAAGERLPATRDVAVQLGIGRNTVAAAYDDLAARGLVAGHVGRGTFVVSRGRPRHSLNATTPRRAEASPGSIGPREFGWAGLLSQTAKMAHVSQAFRRSEMTNAARFDFRGGRVDGASLPASDLRWAFGRPFRNRSTLRTVAQHQDPHGWPPLRREIAKRLTDRGIDCEPADVVVTTGLQQGIDLTARALVEPGDAVALEQPGYFGAAWAFQGRGADLLGVEVDEQGLCTARLARLLRVRRVKLIYVTPAAQSPTGVRLSEPRREELLALADEHQVPVLEDDYDSELRWESPPLPALKASDRAGQIVYAGTFSKALFPGLRVGYVVAAAPLRDRLVTLRAFSDFGTGVVEQAALASLLATRGLERHLQRMRRVYAARRGAMLAALEREMPPGVSWSRPEGGHLVWLRLPADVDPERAHDAALARGVAYMRGDVCFVDGSGADHLALSFASLDEAAIADGIAELALALADARERSARPAARGRLERRTRGRTTARRGAPSRRHHAEA
jgi:DNA-binding transcriptional MocR family regulator